MTIPDEAVEAAAKYYSAGVGVVPNDAWIRGILSAAAPLIQAQALRDAVDAFPLETIHAPDNAVVWLMRRVEQIEEEACR